MRFDLLNTVIDHETKSPALSAVQGFILINIFFKLFSIHKLIKTCSLFTNDKQLFSPRRNEEARRNELNTNDQILTTNKATEITEYTEKTKLNFSNLLIHSLTHKSIIRRVAQIIADKITNEYNLYQNTSWFFVFFVVQQNHLSLSIQQIPS